jgi:acyl dehydratase
MTEVASPPNLLGLYARAAVTAPLHRGDQLPATELVLRDQAIDAGHLAAYQRVCGFRVQDVLPPTYLHVLAFPLAVAVMVDRGFPFPLAGLVHVANVIEHRRPVDADERVTLRVHAADLRRHESGRQVDLLTEASADGETVWRERSTYLKRGARTSRAGARRVGDPPPGPAGLIRVPADTGRRYAAVSGDRNPIHLCRITARVFGFSRAIAHGMWLAARVLSTIEARLPAAYSADVAFKTPVLLPSTVSLVAARVDDGWRLDVRDGRSRKPHLAGTVTPL